ncbi:MAG: Uma2 family endonuclease, partial [Hyphomonadaceae bacterium]|nr:Uma2 family endonuclease [Hyphomonadaceae bacterium]
MNAPARLAPLSPLPTADSPSAEDPALPHRFTWAEVRAMTGADVFGPDRRAELLRGEIFIMPQEGFLHVDGVYALQAWLLAHVSPLGLLVRIREPLYLPGGSVLIPDLCVMPAGTDARAMQAERAALVIEVMDSTEVRDRKLKLPAYAEAG